MDTGILLTFLLSNNSIICILAYSTRFDDVVPFIVHTLLIHSCYKIFNVIPIEKHSYFNSTSRYTLLYPCNDFEKKKLQTKRFSKFNLHIFIERNTFILYTIQTSIHPLYNSQFQHKIRVGVIMMLSCIEFS